MTSLYYLLVIKTIDDMAKYLHRYLNNIDFDRDYNGQYGEVTAITVENGFVYESCNDEATQTHIFDGRYVFDREITVESPTDCEGNPMPFTKARIFKNGDKELVATYYNDDDYWSYDDGWVVFIQDFSHCGQAGDGLSEDFSVERAPAPYHEPWVSVTDDKRVFAYNYTMGESIWYDYVGEVDVYKGEES